MAEACCGEFYEEFVWAEGWGGLCGYLVGFVVLIGGDGIG